MICRLMLNLKRAPTTLIVGTDMEQRCYDDTPSTAIRFERGKGLSGIDALGGEVDISYISSATWMDGVGEGQTTTTTDE